MHSGIVRARQLYIFLFFLLCFVVLAIRLFYLQALRHDFFAKIAVEQHTVSVELPPKRGTIFDRTMRVLAINLNCDSVYANARAIKDKKAVAKALAAVLHIEPDYVFKRLLRNKAFVWIKRKVSHEESAAVRRLKISGIEILQESKRFYPNKNLACHLIGTVDIDNTGLEGIESVFNKNLKGESGWLISTQDARRKLLESYQMECVQPKNGLGMILTIDEVIQSIAERELADICEKRHAKGGSVVVMNPATGDILALANYPGYDLNNLTQRSPDAVRNRAINDFFEPGSIFKVITASAALEEKVVRQTDTFFCENGEYHIGKRILHDVHPYGTLTFREVIEKSSNIGTVKVASRLGAEKMYKYMRSFGFYEKTGISLPGEVVGMNRPLSGWSGVSMYAIPMGQEVTTTVMQLACAVSAIANNGYLVKPRIVKEIRDENGQVVKDFPPVMRRKVISAATAQEMRSILKGVVQVGTGKKAKMEDFSAGGKTGTAQKIEPGGIYSHSRFIASFVGFAPVERPVLTVVVSIDEPRGVYYGGDVAAPVFKNVADESLKYLNAKGAVRGM